MGTEHITSHNPNGEVRQCDKRVVHGPHEWQADFGAYFDVYCSGIQGTMPLGSIAEQTARQYKKEVAEALDVGIDVSWVVMRELILHHRLRSESISDPFKKD